MVEKESIDGILLKTKNDLSLGLLYTHTRINDNTKKILDAASFLYALIELLDEKRLIPIEELDERKSRWRKGNGKFYAFSDL